MDKTKKYKIYFLKDPNTNEIRYVGLSCDVEKRYNEHIKDNKDCYKKRWINKLLSMNKQPILEVVKENLSLSEAFNFEKEYIMNFKNLGVRLFYSLRPSILLNFIMLLHSPKPTKGSHSDTIKFDHSLSAGLITSFKAKK
jgi:predicted GIY-YIG superfamily endonuclease